MKPATHTVEHAIPFKRDSAADEASLGSSGIGVLVVSLIVIAAVLVVRRRLRLGQRQSGRPALLKVLESQRLGPRAVISVVLFNNTQYLLAHGDHGVSCLATAPAGETP